METPDEITTLNCIIIAEKEKTYNVEVPCAVGGTHQHGIGKNEVGVKSHRGRHCLDCPPQGYFLYLSPDEVAAWNQHQKTIKREKKKRVQKS